MADCISWLNSTLGCIIPLRRKAGKNPLLFQLPEFSPSSPTLSVGWSFRQLECCLEGPIDIKRWNLTNSTYWLKYFAATISTLNIFSCLLYLSQVVHNAWDGESFCHQLCHSMHMNESAPQGLQVGEESSLFISSSCMFRPVANTTAMRQARNNDLRGEETHSV